MKTLSITLMSLVASLSSKQPHAEGLNRKLLIPLSLLDDYKSELRGNCPLIAGSAAAGVVFVGIPGGRLHLVCSR